MRNIPVDTSALTFVCVSPPRPKLIDQNTGEVKVDRNGQTVYTVGLSAADESGRVELVNVAVAGDPAVSIGQVVTPVGLVGFPWEQQLGGRMRWGIAYRADQIIPAPTAPIAPVGSVCAGLVVVGRGLIGGPAMNDLLLVLAALAVVMVAGLWAWLRCYPASFWHGIDRPSRMLPVHLTWTRVVSEGHMSRRRRCWRLTLAPSR